MQDERTPLIARGRQTTPWAQFTVLTLCRMIHPICFAVILPFIVRYLLSINAATEQNVGLAAGRVEAAYSIALLIFLYPAGLCSDRFGRKKVLIASLAGCAISISLFGLGRSLNQLILLRLLIGSAVALLPATVMTMLIELSTESTQALAFSLIGTGWAIGSVVAPMIGGVLSDLAQTFPDLEGTIWNARPYLAPGIGVGHLRLRRVRADLASQAAVLAVVALLASIIVLPETLKKKDLTSRKSQSVSEQLTLFTPAVLFMTLMWVFVIVSYSNA